MTSILAQSGAISFLIYLVIGVFWLIGQVAQTKKAKKKAEEMKRRRLEREERERRTGKKEPATKQTTIEAQLEDFLGRLAGEPAPTPAPPPPPPPPPQQRTIVRKNAAKPPPPPAIQFDQAPPPALDSTPEPPKEMVSKSKIKELTFEQDAIKDIAELKEAEEIIGDLMSQEVKHEALRSVGSMKVDLSDITMPMPTIPMQSIRPVPTKTAHPDLKNRAQFRKALITSIILEPPKALQPKPFEGTE